MDEEDVILSINRQPAECNPLCTSIRCRYDDITIEELDNLLINEELVIQRAHASASAIKGAAFTTAKPFRGIILQRSW